MTTVHITFKSIPVTGEEIGGETQKDPLLKKILHALNRIKFLKNWELKRKHIQMKSVEFLEALGFLPQFFTQKSLAD